MAAPKSRPTVNRGLPARSQPQFPQKKSFLDLPAEIRNTIYREAVMMPGKMIDLLAVTKWTGVDYVIKALRLGARGKPALLAVSKQIYYEAHRLYFEGNHFCVTESTLSTNAIEALVQTIPDPGKIRMVSLQRTYYIVEQKVNVRFTAMLQPAKVKGALQPRVLIHRGDRVVFPGIGCKKVGDLAEPCRCDVKRLAWESNSGATTDGNSIFTFLLAYAATVTTKSKELVVKTCPKCGSAIRY